LPTAVACNKEAIKVTNKYEINEHCNKLTSSTPTKGIVKENRVTNTNLRKWYQQGAGTGRGPSHKGH